MRKVLFLTASYPTPEAPALGIFVKEHARAVASECDVAVVHLDRTDSRGLRVDVATDEEFPTVRVRYPRSPTFLSYAMNVFAAAAGLRRLRRNGFQPDIIHAHFFLAAVPAILLRPWHRCPVVVTEQWSVFLPDDPATLSPLVRLAAKFAFERAERVMPVSDALRHGIRAHGIDARFHVVPNVVDTRLFHPPAERAGLNGRPTSVLAVGAMYEAKGYEILLRAVALVAQSRDDFHVEVVGDGDLRPSCEALRRELALESVVTFRGWETKQRVAELMQRADLYLLTSRYDSNPCALIEALATGLPVVATAVGGVPSMVDAGVGLLAAPNDPESVAEQLRLALDRLDSFDRAAIAEQARARYGRERVAEEFHRIYETALAARQ